MTTTADTSPRRRAGLPWRAQVYLLAVSAAAIGGYLAAKPASAPSAADWRLAALLGALAAVAQLFVVVTPRNQSYHLTPGIVIAAAILLPAPLVALVIVVQHLTEWLKARYPWFIQTFNIANFAIAALLAGRVFDLRGAFLGSYADKDVGFFLAGLAAAIAFVAVQHTLLALVLKFARGHTLVGTGLFAFQSLSMDLVLAVIGVVVASL